MGRLGMAITTLPIYLLTYLPTYLLTCLLVLPTLSTLLALPTSLPKIISIVSFVV